MMLKMILMTNNNVWKDLSWNIVDQLWGWVLTASGGRVAGAIVILVIFYKVIETLILGTVKKLRKPKQGKRSTRNRVDLDN